MGTIKNLDAKEQKAFTMCVVQECLNYANTNKKSFEDVLVEDLLPGEGNQVFTDMIYRNIKHLVKDGYLAGVVELQSNSFEEDAEEDISIELSTVENITITEQGKVYMKSGEFGVIISNAKEKVKPVLKCIATTALEAAVETLVAMGTNAVVRF